jgi:AcrR family transcriptional regulator
MPRSKAIVRAMAPTPTATGARDRDLSLNEIVRAAIDLLDDGGVAAFSMRALAKNLGCSPMAAYRHVQNREALLQLAAAGVLVDVPDVASLPWDERLETYSRHAWATTWRDHPWTVDFVESVGLTEQGVDLLGLLEQAFRDAGFADDQLREAVRSHWAFVVGTLRLIIAASKHAGRRDRASEDAIFEFNLRTWILGVGAMAQQRQVTR